VRARDGPSMALLTGNTARYAPSSTYSTNSVN
jgi:hypothetical protein